MDFRTIIMAPRLRYLYELLQLEANASAEQVTRAYRALVRQYHPDKVGGDEALLRVFHDLQEAYETLRDPYKIRQLNEEFYAALPSEVAVGGKVFSIGSFFGMRFFRRREQSYHRHGGRVRALLTTTAAPSSVDDHFAQFFDDNWFEGETSILDHPDWDILEIMMAGAMTEEQLAVMEEIYARRGLEGATETPWFMQNMEGFYHFSRRAFKKAMRCFEELTRTIPHNIIFLYRYGLCCEAFHWQAKEEGWEIYLRDNRLLQIAAQQYERALHIAWSRRKDERQECFTIQKALADLYEDVGERGKARKLWERIRTHRGKSLEAQARLKQLSLWRSLFGALQRRQERRLLTDSAVPKPQPPEESQ
ncbi:MAG TPA: J domain-containing protein [bacterium]|nr:J domain-containing protein [bacterium]